MSRRHKPGRDKGVFPGHRESRLSSQAQVDVVIPEKTDRVLVDLNSCLDIIFAINHFNRPFGIRKKQPENMKTRWSAFWRPPPTHGPYKLCARFVGIPPPTGTLITSRWAPHSTTLRSFYQLLSLPLDLLTSFPTSAAWIPSCCPYITLNAIDSMTTRALLFFLGPPTPDALASPLVPLLYYCNFPTASNSSEADCDNGGLRFPGHPLTRFPPQFFWRTIYRTRPVII